jgi:uncharacterized protein (DUF1697 family)
MTRYVAFLRGVSPLNAKMPDIRRCFEGAGFKDVRTLLSSGNVAFSARSISPTALERRAEQAMLDGLGKSFGCFVRPALHLQELIAAEHFAEFSLAPEAKPVVTFLRAPAPRKLSLPLERDGARILKLRGTEVFSAYLPSEKGPVFMSLLERTFGAEITTRTLETVRKCSVA